VLNSTYISDLRKDTTIVGNNVLGANIIRDGDLGVIAGARIYQFANLSANSENLAGWVAGPDAIAFASALPDSMDIPGFEVSNATDAGTGLGVQVLVGMEQSGYLNVTATLMFGAAVGRATSLVRLKTA
jgi:phage terminase large subunit-like protein